MSQRAYWICICFFVALVALKFSPQAGFTSLIRFGETWAARRHVLLEGMPVATVVNSNGYDGQFYAQIALDPFLRHPDTARVLDIPAYRARRILTPATASIAGLGNPWWTLQAYALINVGCWFMLAWLLAKALPTSDPANFARWLGCMFSMGVLESVRQSLVDLPALLLLTVAISAQAKSHTIRSTMWLALGNLTKESNLLGAFALCFGDPKRPFPFKKALLSFSLAAIPLLAWSWYVGYRLPSPSESGGLGNFTWPLLGLGLHFRSCLTELAAGNWDGRFSMGLLGAVGFITQAWFLWRHPNLQSGWWRAGAAYAFLFLFLSPWVWSGYWAVSRVVLPMTVAFNLLLPSSSRTFWPLWALGNVSMLHAVWRFL
jgi:hypothetical protein